MKFKEKKMLVYSSTPIEAKYQKLQSAQTTRSFKSFLDKYKPKKAYIVHLGQSLEDTFRDTKIFFLPFYESKNITKSLQ